MTVIILSYVDLVDDIFVSDWMGKLRHGGRLC